ncbi:MAG: hypothetical protein AAGA54_22220 [Myxococcota bacterium]
MYTRRAFECPRSWCTFALVIGGTCLAVGSGCGPRPLRIHEPELRELEPKCAPAGLQACEADCEAGDGVACVAAAMAYEYGIRVEINRWRMMEFEKQACELDVGLGCRYYAFNRELSLDEAHRAAAKGCGLRDEASCWMSVDLAARRVVEEEAPLSVVDESLDAGCGAAPGLCASIADLEALGVGRPVDMTRARRLYAHACRAGRPNACMSLDEPNRPTVSLPLNLFFPEAHMPLTSYEGGGQDVAPVPFSATVTMTARICFAEDGGFALETVESSGLASFDHGVRKDSADWAFLMGPLFPLGREFCFLESFTLNRGVVARTR